MTGKAQEVLEAAMKLSYEERAELAAILEDSVGDGTPETEVEAAWIEEAKRRLARIRAGESRTFSTDEVEAELDQIASSAPNADRAPG